MTSRWPPEPAQGFLVGALAEAVGELSPTPPIAAGAVVAGKYRVDAVIGFGGMGVVCAGTHVELGTPIAIKFVRPERGSDERAVARFLTEARAAAQLKSQHACRVMDCGRLDSGPPYIVMEHLHGADLRTLLDQRGPLSIEDTISFALQACEALAEAHAKHIVHRDVKPENLFLTEGPDASPLLKVLDFGISKQGGPLAVKRVHTEPTESMGSPFHMSPEQMVDPAGVDSRTDIWSLGVVLYEGLTGQLPFSGDTIPQLCANVMTTEPLSPQLHRAEIPDGLARIVLRCLEKDPSRRYQDVAELSVALKEFGGAASSLAAARVERILGRTPLPGPPPSPSPRESEPDSAPSEHDRVSASIPGVPRRGLGRRLFVGVILIAASGLAGYAAHRVLEPAPPPPLAPSAHAPPASAPPGISAPPATSAPAAISAAPSALPKGGRSRSSASAPTAVRPRAPIAPPSELADPPKPAPAPDAPTNVDSPTVYPELKPIPELPPPE